jgi:hypothetical protein
MSRGRKARQSSPQLNNADPLVGIVVNLPRHCQRGHDMCRVGPGRDPHRASLQCARCGRHRGWLSHKTANFLSAVIARFGRPVAPVRVRAPSETSNLRIVDNGEASTVAHVRAEEAPENVGTNALKFLLKRLARQYSFKCLDVREKVVPAAASHLSYRTGHAFQHPRDNVARRARVVPLDPNASALVIETAITDNAPPFNQPWPPTGLGDGWHAVDKFSTRQRTFWRRFLLERARPSPRARPTHR